MDKPQIPESENAGRARDRGPRLHPNLIKKLSGHVTPFDRFLLAISPAGSRKEILATLDNRYTWEAIKHWRQERRCVPQWVMDRLLDRVRQYAGQIRISQDASTRADGAKAYWARRARERDAQKKRG